MNVISDKLYQFVLTKVSEEWSDAAIQREAHMRQGHPEYAVRDAIEQAREQLKLHPQQEER